MWFIEMMESLFPNWILNDICRSLMEQPEKWDYDQGKYVIEFEGSQIEVWVANGFICYNFYNHYKFKEINFGLSGNIYFSIYYGQWRWRRKAKMKQLAKMKKEERVANKTTVADIIRKELGK